MSSDVAGTAWLLLAGALFAAGMVSMWRSHAGGWDGDVTAVMDAVTDADVDLGDDEINDLALWALECGPLAVEFDRLGRHDWNKPNDRRRS